MIGIFARGRGLGTLVGPNQSTHAKADKADGQARRYRRCLRVFVSEDGGYITGQILGVNGGRNT